MGLGMYAKMVMRHPQEEPQASPDHPDLLSSPASPSSSKEDVVTLKAEREEEEACWEEANGTLPQKALGTRRWTITYHPRKIISGSKDNEGAKAMVLQDACMAHGCYFSALLW